MFRLDISAIDEVLPQNKGILMEISGSSGSGRTQFLFHIAASCIVNQVKVLFIDLPGTFRISRILEIVENRYDLGRDNITLDILKVIRVRSWEQMVSALVNREIDVFLIDSIHKVLPEPRNINETRTYYSRLSLLLNQLLLLAEKGYINIVTTYWSGKRFFADPYLSFYWTHRILLERNGKNIKAKIIYPVRKTVILELGPWGFRSKERSS